MIRADRVPIDLLFYKRAPNQRMKLAARGGRLLGKELFLIAAAAGCSLCAFR